MDELLNLLGYPDPEIRDTQAYRILAGWTLAGHFGAELERLASVCAALLTGENVLSRSFAALILGEAVAREAKLPARTDWIQRLALRAWSD